MKVISNKMIPTPCSSNHASNLLELAGGDLLCTWFGGSMEGTADISIYLSRYIQSEGKWLEPDKISQDETRSEQNPVLFQKSDNEIWLFYTAQLKTDQGTSLVRIRKSFDEGKSWTPEENLFPQSGTFVRQSPIFNRSGHLLIPVFHSNIIEAFGNDSSSVFISEDDGQSWRLKAVPASNGCVHMNIMSNCRVAFFRRRRSDAIFRCVSKDDGVNWSEPEATSLPNNNSSIQGRLLSDGRIVLVYNHRKSEGALCESSVPPWVKDKPSFLSQFEVTERSAIWGVPRNPLYVAISEDLGASWEKVMTLEDDAYLQSDYDKEGSFIGDYSYPSVIQTSDGKLQITYSYLRDSIKHVTLDL